MNGPKRRDNRHFTDLDEGQNLRHGNAHVNFERKIWRWLDAGLRLHRLTAGHGRLSG
jgi:hypothetical protein